MAHTKAGGSTSLGRDSQAKRLGVKRSEGATVREGSIIIRQRGTKYIPGKNVRKGEDDTLYAVQKGTVHFLQRAKKNFTGKLKKRTIVTVV
ncbi:MAG: 50S ribosomal protein L27 [Patescibacteria group bacterium]